MSNKFLDNVKEGENNWWKYLLTIFLSNGLSGVVSGVLISLIIICYIIFTGNFNLDYIPSIDNYKPNPISFFIITFITSLFSIIFFFISIKLIHKRKLMSVINTSESYDIFGKPLLWIKRIRWNKILKGMLVWSASLIIIKILLFITNPNAFVFNFNIENIYLVLFLFILAIPIQVTFEELFYRGYLNQGISLKIKNPIIIILISSIIFSLGHIFNGGMNPILMIQNVLVTFLFGMIFSVATLVDNGIELAIGAHLSNNFFAFLINSSEGNITHFNTLLIATGINPIVELVIVTGVLLIFSLILFFYKKEAILKTFEIK